MARFDRDGYAIADLVLTASACDRISRELPEIEARHGGVRDLLHTAIVVRLVQSPELTRAVREFVDPPLVAVKATVFDKTPQSNWRVQWHQDRMIAVRAQAEVPGYGPWSIKKGVPHVEPPPAVLERMVALRIHLDECGPDNAPLRVIPGSHRNGKLSDDQISATVDAGSQAALTVPKGAILLMRPLLLHASSPSVSAEHRRVLHIELAPPDAIAPLDWNGAVGLGSV
jgi:ectoine hydroxylase-related dioxygenase (phytanoyl-CoA dioxygenase family)